MIEIIKSTIIIGAAANFVYFIANLIDPGISYWLVFGIFATGIITQAIINGSSDKKDKK